MSAVFRATIGFCDSLAASLINCLSFGRATCEPCKACCLFITRTGLSCPAGFGGCSLPIAMTMEGYYFAGGGFTVSLVLTSDLGTDPRIVPSFKGAGLEGGGGGGVAGGAGGGVAGFDG